MAPSMAAVLLAIAATAALLCPAPATAQTLLGRVPTQGFLNVKASTREAQREREGERETRERGSEREREGGHCFSRF